MLKVNNLQCDRGDRALFTGISFELQKHQLMRIEGLNGSGKTTLLRTLCGLFEPEEGEILWDGTSIKKQDDSYRKNLFYLGHQNAIKMDLSVLENLRFNCKMAGESPSDEELLNALNTIGLFAYEDIPTRQLSQGQKRRVSLARLLVTDTSLWILDEPFVALDIAAVELLQKIIADHVDNRGMVILTTHQEVPLTSGKAISINLDQLNKQEVEA